MTPEHHDTLERCSNYILGSCGVGISLIDITSWAQGVATIAGAILICRQLWRDLKKK